MEFTTSNLSNGEVASPLKRVKSMASAVSGHTSDEQSDTSSEPSHEGDSRLQRMAAAMRTVIECMGEDADREGLERTPMRAAKALQFFTQGYCMTVSDVVGEGVFNEETSNDMVVVRNIDIHSLCEHHMVPFSGKVHIAYIPQGKILGLSKLARIANLFARRLQVQERLTRQIAQAIMEAIEPLGVGVVIEASHMCMVMRGVEKAGASTVTSTVLGSFSTDRQTRKEFFDLINAGLGQRL
jgi:GTP cyclohydrolase I